MKKKMEIQEDKKRQVIREKRSRGETRLRRVSATQPP